MRLLRGMAMAGIAKKAYDWARRPENQAKIKQGVERVKQRGGGQQGGSPGGPR